MSNAAFWESSEHLGTTPNRKAFEHMEVHRPLAERLLSSNGAFVHFHVGGRVPTREVCLEALVFRSHGLKATHFSLSERASGPEQNRMAWELMGLESLGFGAVFFLCGNLGRMALEAS